MPIADNIRNDILAFRKACADEFGYSLECFCAICSYALWKYLRKKKIASKFVLGDYRGYDHCFLIIEDYVVDITATQFGLSELEIVEFEGSDYDYYKSNQDAVNHVNLDWPKDQSPKYNLEVIWRIINEQAARSQFDSQLLGTGRKRSRKCLARDCEAC